jgi:hypothetical protein
MKLSTRTLAIAAVVVGLLVFCSEVTLALVRSRSIDVTFGTGAGSASATPDVAATPDAAKSSVLTIKAIEPLNVTVKWNYRIGPRFPVTVIRAEAISPSDNHIAASEEYTIDCGAEALQCSGEHLFELHYGVKDKQGTPLPWPLGDYLVQVSQHYSNLQSSPLRSQPFKVAP